MVCHSVCGADDMTDVTIWQNSLPRTSITPLTLGSHNAPGDIFFPNVSGKYASTCVTP